MAILKRSKKSIIGLDIQLSNMETNLTNNASNISAEITRAQNAESSLSSEMNNVKANLTILNADNTTNGSVDKKIADAMAGSASSNDVYTKAETDTLLGLKVDTSLTLSDISSGNKVVTETELNLKANSADVYNKSDMDTALNGKADISSVYTKSQSDSNLADKADADTTYTKTETDALVSPKANSADIYTKTDVDTALTNKIDTSATVSELSDTNKVVTQNELNTKSNVSDVYTKSDIDTKMGTVILDTDTVSSVTDDNKVVTQTELSLKANSADIYTKTQMDDSLSNKADASVAGKIGPSLKVIDESNMDNGKILSYNSNTDKIEFVSQIDTGAIINDSETNDTEAWSSNKINTELNTKANSSDVYTKTETDDKISASAQGLKYTVDTIEDRDAITGMEQDDQCLVDEDRTVYKYDETNGWESFYKMDATHNHDDIYYRKTDIDTALDSKADSGVSYTKADTDTLLDGKAAATSVGKVGASLIEVDETNKADKKVLSYNNSTGKLEYVIQDGSNIIDDENSTDTSTYSSNKVNALVNTKANAATTYTKSDIDTKMDDKVNVNDVKSTIASDNKVVTETELATKADSATTYTKGEVDTVVNSKVNTSDVLTAIDDDNKVVTQADIVGKADASSVYTKSESDNLVAGKANSDDVYTKSEIDTSLSGKLNTDTTVTAVDADNKIITENELSVKADQSTTYSKTEVDSLVNPKFDNSNSLSDVTASNKIVTETELANKVNITDVKSTIAADNKVVTETDLTQAIAASEAAAATAPVVVVDRPIMTTKSSNDLDYVFEFALSRKPHGLVAIQDEILIYDFEDNGDAAPFENVSLFDDKHGEIAVTLNSTDEESKYDKKTIKVCYLSTETTVAPGTDAEHPIIIDAGCDFEDQGDGTTLYSIDYSKGNFYRVTFTDGFYTNVNHDTAHTNFHDDNDTDYQAFNFNGDNEIRSNSWAGFDDEVEYTTYNWTMSLDVDSGDTYKLEFTRGDEVGGGGL